MLTLLKLIGFNCTVPRMIYVSISVSFIDILPLVHSHPTRIRLPVSSLILNDSNGFDVISRNVSLLWR